MCDTNNSMNFLQHIEKRRNYFRCRSDMSPANFFLLLHGILSGVGVAVVGYRYSAVPSIWLLYALLHENLRYCVRSAQAQPHADSALLYSQIVPAEPCGPVARPLFSLCGPGYPTFGIILFCFCFAYHHWSSTSSRTGPPTFKIVPPPLLPP